MGVLDDLYKGPSRGLFDTLYPQNDPWYLKPLGAVGRALEPLALPGALLRSGIEDLAGGGQGKFASTLRNAATYAPFGAQPTQYSTGETFLQTLGVKAPNKWASLLTEFAVDPLLFGSWITGAGKAAKALGMANEAKSMFRAAETMNYLTSYKAGGDLLRKGVSALGGDGLMESISKRVFDLMDTPLTVGGFGIPSPGSTALTKAARSSDPLLADVSARTRYATLADLFPQSVVPGARSRLQGGINPPEQMVGAYKMGLDQPNAGVGYLREARGAETQFRELAQRTTFRVNQWFDEVSNKVFGAPSVNPFVAAKTAGARTDLKRQLNDLAGAWLDDLGGGVGTLVPGYLQRTQTAVRDIAQAGNQSDFATLIVSNAQNAQKYMDKANSLADAFGLDRGLVRGAITKAAAEGFAVSSYIGSELVGLPTFQRVVDRVAQRTGKTSMQVWGSLVDESRRVENFAKEGPTFLRDPINLQQITYPTPAASAAAQQRINLAETFAQEAKALGADDFATINILEYVRGLDSGYLRKLYGGVMDPSGVAQRLKTREVNVFKKLEPTKFEAGFQSYGTDAAKAVADLVASKPSGVLYLRDVQTTLSAKLGRAIDQEEVANILRTVDPDADMFAQTYTILRDKGNALQQQIGAPLKFGLQRGKFEERDLDEVQRLLMVEQQGLTQRVANLGVYSGRAINSQIVLQQSRDMLKAEGMIYDDFQNAINAAPDVKWMRLPDSPETWGDLANKVVPEWMTRQITQVLRLPSEAKSDALARIMGTVRGGYLSGFGTTIRNVMGNFALMQQAGVDLTEIVPYMARGWKAIGEHQTRGYSKELAGAERYLNLFSDGTMASQVKAMPEQMLGEAVRGAAEVDRGFLGDLAHAVASRDAKKVARSVLTLENLQRLNNTAPFGWLKQFQKTEDGMRSGIFLWARDKLMANGMAKEDAVNQAAHFSNNALYDYAHGGAMVEMLRNSGLALFPAFSFFTVGRVARGVWEKPAPLAMQEGLVNLASNAMTDEQDRDKIDRMIHDTWLGQSRPMPIPAEFFGGEKGKYYLLPLSNILPQGALNPQGLSDTYFTGPLVGGFWQPFVNMGVAFATGTGEAPTMAKYGEKVFESNAQGIERGVQALGFLARAYDPSTAGTIQQAVAKWPLIVDQRQADYAAHQLDKWMGTDWQQQMGRAVGFSTQKFDTNEGVSQRSRARQIQAQADEQLKTLATQKRMAMATRNVMMLQSIATQEQEIRKQLAERMRVLFGG